MKYYLISLLLIITSCYTSFHSEKPRNIIIEEVKVQAPKINSIPNIVETSKRAILNKNYNPSIKVAILAPLTGKYKDIGESIIDSSTIALFNYNDSKISILPFDTKGDSFGAKDAAQKAINQGVNIIVGPVFASSALAIKDLINQNNIPAISFSNDSRLANSGVFSFGYNPEDQIRRITRFAIANGIIDFTALLPNNAYGAISARTFRNVVQDNNAEILKTEFYKRNLPRSVRNIVDYSLNKRAERDYDEELLQYNEEEIAYPRGLLLPQGGKKLEFITNLLKKNKFDSQKIQLLGSYEWLNDLDLLTNDVFDGALFTIADYERIKIFETDFFNYFGYKPHKLSNIAYDSIALSVVLGNLNSSSYSFERITHRSGFKGISGIFRFNYDGTSERGYAIATIKNNKIEIIDDFPRSF